MNEKHSHPPHFFDTGAEEFAPTDRRWKNVVEERPFMAVKERFASRALALGAIGIFPELL
jgi:hypothetical protein